MYECMLKSLAMCIYILDKLSQTHILFCLPDIWPMFLNHSSQTWGRICLAWGCLPDLPMDATGHSYDENEEWLRELLQYNREAHE